MPDIYCNWQQDLGVAANGDLRAVDGMTRGRQRIIRRLMTILGEYLWHTDYGASVPARIGDTLDMALIKSVISSQIFLEDSVACSPQKQIIVNAIPYGVTVRILYTDAGTATNFEIAYDVSP
jgi:hypothetical protein